MSSRWEDSTREWKSKLRAGRHESAGTSELQWTTEGLVIVQEKSDVERSEERFMC